MTTYANLLCDECGGRTHDAQLHQLTGRSTLTGLFSALCSRCGRVDLERKSRFSFPPVTGTTPRLLPITGYDQQFKLYVPHYLSEFSIGQVNFRVFEKYGKTPAHVQPDRRLPDSWLIDISEISEEVESESQCE